jgi:putative membrane protein
MKKNYLNLATCLLAATIWSCSDNNTHGTETTTDSTTSTTTMNTDSSRMNSDSATAKTTYTNTTPLGKSDSMFVMEAAMGGMMEVQAGNLAQQQAMNQRVKDFGAMMVQDHSQANNELKSLASSKGLMIPDSLSSDKQKHVDAMKKMNGKSFDSHYISMMLDDHKKDVKKFEDESKNAKDADLRNWAGKTLPTLQKHLDSIQAISKAKM